jgi:nitrate/TMAO reductase-like tetraheme cytochrome c subunit
MPDVSPAISSLGVLALISALAAASILVHYLVKKPVLNVATKLRLLLGLGVLPTLAAGASTVEGMEQTTHREFCGSCHVMGAHFDDTKNPKAQSLAARHSRNPFFGDRSCYVCHADYGMFGYALTKAGGLRHVYLYYLGGYRQMSLAQAEKQIHLIKPYNNQNCRQCHTTTLHDWRRVPDHDSLKAELDSNKVSCASAGCHGYAHPFTKPDGSATLAAPPLPALSASAAVESPPPPKPGSAP